MYFSISNCGSCLIHCQISTLNVTFIDKKVIANRYFLNFSTSLITSSCFSQYSKRIIKKLTTNNHRLLHPNLSGLFFQLLLNKYSHFIFFCPQILNMIKFSQFYTNLPSTKLNSSLLFSANFILRMLYSLVLLSYFSIISKLYCNPHSKSLLFFFKELVNVLLSASQSPLPGSSLFNLPTDSNTAIHSIL